MKPIILLLAATLLILACATVAVLPTPTALPSPTPTPSPTPIPPEPETALGIALERFTTARSFTVNTVTHYDFPDQDMVLDSEGETLVNLVKEIYLLSQSSKSSTLNIEMLCVKGSTFLLDATGLYKPTSRKCGTSNIQPMVPELTGAYPELTDYQEFTSNYAGEEMLGGVRTFKYEMIITDQQLNDPGIKSSITSLKISYYVSADDGNLARMEYSIETISDTSGVAQRQSTADYSAWNATTMTVPEYVDTNNSETQTYEGQQSGVFTFDFHKTYQFYETSNGDPELTTPAGGKMSIQIYGMKLATLSDGDADDSVCKLLMKVNWFDEVIHVYDPTASIVSAQWVTNGELRFCKAVFSPGTYPGAIYMFNEPPEIVRKYGHILPTTFYINIIPRGDEDPATIFWDVISTIRFVK